jgi:hypothetical protein
MGKKICSKKIVCVCERAVVRLCIEKNMETTCGGKVKKYGPLKDR